MRILMRMSREEICGLVVYIYYFRHYIIYTLHRMHEDNDHNN